MLTLPVYNSMGKILEDKLTLDQVIFNKKIKDTLLFQAVITQVANIRKNISHTKNRAEVSGGGRKPWKQKGTGNARVGSSRSPLWRGGGVTFGPRKTKRYAQKITKKMRTKSIFMALSSKLIDKKIIILNKIDFDKIKTKQAYSLIQNLPITEGSILLILEKPNQTIQLSFRNMPFVKVILVKSLNVLDILKYDWLILTKNSLKEINKVYLPVKHKLTIQIKNNQVKPENKKNHK